MAKNEAPEEEQNEAELQAALEQAAKKKKLMVLGGVVLLLLLLAGGGSWLALKMFGGGKPKPEVAARPEQEPAHGEAAAPAKPGKTSFYDALDPAFLANFMVNGRQHYLQLSLSAMARDEGAVAALHEHMPLVRNRVVMLLSDQQFEQLQTDDGRQQLQQKLLASIQEIMNKETGKPQIEQVFFTNFVMQ